MQAFNTIKTGEIAGSLSILQLPDVPCSMVKIKAKGANTGRVYIGGSAVSVPNGNTSITAGWELAAGVDSDWIYIDNLNKLYSICNTGGDGLVYMALR